MATSKRRRVSVDLRYRKLEAQSAWQELQEVGVDYASKGTDYQAQVVQFGRSLDRYLSGAGVSALRAWEAMDGLEGGYVYRGYASPQDQDGIWAAIVNESERVTTLLKVSTDFRAQPGEHDRLLQDALWRWQRGEYDE
jgi:hypothetical protein